MALFGLFGAKKSKSESSFNQTQDVRNEILGRGTFEQLFKGAGGAISGIDTGALTQTANELFASGQGFTEGLRGISEGTDVAGQFLQGQVSGDSGLLEENIAGLRQDLGQLFSEEFMPAITGQSVAAGQLGGGRQGVAQGAAAASLAREFQRGSTALRTGDVANRTAAASTLAANQLTAAQAGISAGATQFDIAQAGAMAPLSPYAALSQILGDPIITSTSTSQKGKSKTKGSSAEVKIGF